VDCAVGIGLGKAICEKRFGNRKVGIRDFEIQVVEGILPPIYIGRG
jgi:hypothetical protein